MLSKVEYRVVPITRFQVTRYEEGVDDETDGAPRGNYCGCSQQGEFDNQTVAYEVAYALAAAEHQRLGWPLDDDRIKYPSGDPRYADAKPVTA